MNTDYAKSLAQQHGCHFFDDAAMRFFNSRIRETTWTAILDPLNGEQVHRFISSEKFDAGYTRWYTVRELRYRQDRDTGTITDVSVETVGEFQQYATARTALAHIRDGEVTD